MLGDALDGFSLISSGPFLALATLPVDLDDEPCPLEVDAFDDAVEVDDF